MGIYYATLASTFILSLLARMANDKKYKLIAIFWISLVVSVLVLFSGLRSGIGDTGMYKHTYNLLVENPSFSKANGDYGFVLLNLILIQFSNNPQTIVFVVALITQLCNVYVLNKYRGYIELEIFMYIAAGYFTVTMNGMRQCLAAALLFLCVKFIIDGSFKKYLLSVLIISTIHQSALFMIPIYFIARLKPWSKKIYMIIGIAVLGLLFYEVLSSYLFKIIENTNYGYYSDFDEGGSSIMRTLVNMVPIIFAYLKRNELKEKWPQSNVFVNMALLNCIFVAFGMSNWIFNRFSLYLQLYNFILLPYIIQNCLEGKQRRTIYLAFIVCYLIFFYREQVIGLNMEYKSVLDIKSIFYYTPNHR